MKKRSKRRKIRYDRVALLVAFTMTFIVVIIVCINQIFFHKEEGFDKKAIWISYLDMETLKDKNEEDFTSAFTIMCEKVKEYKCDTLIVQARAFQDAIYPSDIFPYAKYLSEKDDMNYDALEIMVEVAHKQNLKIEAWVNPYRISYQEDQYKRFIKQVDFPKQDILVHGDDAILNPKSNTSTTLIVEGVKELLEYDVDGIHMDDYFYPEWAYANTTENNRKLYVNKMIQEVYKVVHEHHKTFGISPQGNIENCHIMGADIETWMHEDNYVDYIMPQIYWSNAWGMDGSITMFSDRVDAWSQLARNSDVPIYAGLALYLCGNEVYGDLGWSQTDDNLKQQIQYLQTKQWNGYSLFSYSDLLTKEAQSELEKIQ